MQRTTTSGAGAKGVHGQAVSVDDKAILDRPHGMNKVRETRAEYEVEYIFLTPTRQGCSTGCCERSVIMLPMRWVTVVECPPKGTSRHQPMDHGMVGAFKVG